MNLALRVNAVFLAKARRSTARARTTSALCRTSFSTLLFRARRQTWIAPTATGARAQTLTTSPRHALVTVALFLAASQRQLFARSRAERKCVPTTTTLNASATALRKACASILAACFLTKIWSRPLIAASTQCAPQTATTTGCCASAKKVWSTTASAETKTLRARLLSPTHAKRPKHQTFLLVVVEIRHASMVCCGLWVA